MKTIWLIFVLCVSICYAQKSDRLIQVPRFAGYHLDCAQITLPRGSILVGIHVHAKNSDGIGVDALPKGWVSYVSQEVDDSVLYLFPGPKTKFDRMRDVLHEFDRLMVVYPKQISDPAPQPKVTLSFEYYEENSGTPTASEVSEFKLVGDVLVPNCSTSTR